MFPLDFSNNQPATVPDGFQGLRRTMIRKAFDQNNHITSLSHVHQRIFAPLECSVDIFPYLHSDSHKPR